ncbi:ABC transporter permease [Microlunatus soli]|uniref:ABC-2 type transport system permease protein n=1 Tax=Microlunatus soli TaxID=630515 RepID=A0A1H1VQV6_9ACTN|nr:ABC-2 family transporter protein [Microlunatus soli]SDS87133.1 ABC-2 type transport system permease protein [Microlunatus soli]
MRRYFLLASAEFRRQSTYRLALAAGIFTNSIFGFIRFSVFYAALIGAGGTIAGYDKAEASTYVWLGQGLLAGVGLMSQHEVSQKVRTGEIAIELSRPLDLQLSYWARDFGRAALMLPARGIIPVIVGALTTGLVLPDSWTALPYGIVSLILAVSISFLLRYGVNLISFWTLDVQGYTNLYLLLMSLLSGFYVPVHIFPGWLQTIAHASPFPSMLQSPIDVLSGRVLGVEALQVIGTQLFWVAALVVITRVMLWRASARLVVQGG